MPVFTDQLGRKVDIPVPPQRIISLVPSQTELLYDLGQEQQVTGITKFCVHPSSWFRQKTRIGGTKAVKMDSIQQLQPDLIIANKEENVKEQIEELEQQYPVWISDVNTLDDAIAMIEQIGAITRQQEKAAGIIQQIQSGFNELTTIVEEKRTSNTKLKTAYLIWRNPYMTIGNDTFIHDMLTRCGFENIFANRTRYLELNFDELRIANCQLLLLPSEPFPFSENHIPELQKQLPATKILLVDGEFFSWYGSRLIKAPGYFKDILNSIEY